MQKLAPVQEEEEKEKTNVVDLKLLTGGKGPTDDDNWLAALPVGTLFLFRNKNRNGPGDVGVQRAVIVYQFETCTLLFDNLNQEVYFIVESRPFSAQMKKVQVIHQEEKKEEEPHNEPTEPSS